MHNTSTYYILPALGNWIEKRQDVFNAWKKKEISASHVALSFSVFCISQIHRKFLKQTSHCIIRRGTKDSLWLLKKI